MQEVRSRLLQLWLANGVDHHTGEIMQIEGPLQNPNTVRALLLAIKGLQLLERKEERSNRLPLSAGKPWTISDDEELVKEFDSDRTIKELSEEYDRTVGAIRSRLVKVKLGKIESEENTTNQFHGNNSHTNSWKPQEDEQLIRDYDIGVPLRELSLKFRKNIGAIQTRLLKLGRKIF